MAAGDLNKKLPPTAETSAATKKDKERSRKSSRLQVPPSRFIFAAESNCGKSPSVVNSTRVGDESGEKPTNMLAEEFGKVLNIKLPSATSSKNDAPPAAASFRAFTPLPDCPVLLPLPVDLGSRKTSAMRGFGPFGAFGSNKGDEREDGGSVSSQYTMLDLTTLDVGSNGPKKNALSTLPPATIPWTVPPVPVDRSESNSTSEDDSDVSTPSRTSPRSIAVLGGNRKKFVKPAPQCYHWQKPKAEHRLSRPNCPFFHPREACKYFPQCRIGAEKCGFGHPFCAPYCKCRSFERSHQHNHRDLPQGQKPPRLIADAACSQCLKAAEAGFDSFKYFPQCPFGAEKCGRGGMHTGSSPARMKTGGPMSQSLRPAQASTQPNKVVTGSNRLALSGVEGKWTAKKRAPQCVYWSDPEHDTNSCYFWHPRLQCKYFPKCTTGAEKCTFAHPFCSPQGFCKCEEGRGRSSQHNHRVSHFKTEHGEED